MPPKGRGRGRGRKSTRGRKQSAPSTRKTSKPSSLSEEEGDNSQPNHDEKDDDKSDVKMEDDVLNDSKLTSLDIEEDISKLEAPTFTTIDRGPPDPLHNNTKLKWDFKVNLIGEKVVNPLLHCCEKCLLPILIYGRMIPCKHVFCLECGKKAGKSCPRCLDKASRVEQSALGTVFMCMYGGSRHGHDGCRRTYLSQRDLQAHINHRHLRPAHDQGTGSLGHKSSPKFDHSAVSISSSKSSIPLSPRDPRCHMNTQAAIKQTAETQHHHHHMHMSSATTASSVNSRTSSVSAAEAKANLQKYVAPLPVISSNTRTNLITIPIQQDSSASRLVHSTVPPSTTATDYRLYGSLSSSSGQPGVAAPVVVPPPYQMSVNNPYAVPPPTHNPAAPASYQTLPPNSYTAAISTTQHLSFSQPPPNMAPPPVYTQPSVVPQIYGTPPPAVPTRPNIPPPPTRVQGMPPPRHRYPTAPYDDAGHVSSPPYQWQSAAPPRGVPPPRNASYRPPYYQHQ